VKTSATRGISKGNAIVNTRTAGVGARPALSFIAILAIILLAFAAIRPGALLAAQVEPEHHEGNPTCGDLGDYEHEFKIEPVSTGLHQDPDSDFEVTITVHDTDDGQTFDFSANLGVEAVFAKGGNEGNLYVYEPSILSDTGLHAPANQSGKWAGLSHLSFCFGDEPQPTPTPTPTPTPEEPTPTPTPTPEEPTPTPTPTPTPEEETTTPTPTPTPEEETPSPTPTPEEEILAGTPTPTPEEEILAGTPTPTPEQAVLADTAAQSVSGSLAAGIFAAILLISLVAMGKLNAVAARRRR
jgi:hypothetical protein